MSLTVCVFLLFLSFTAMQLYVVYGCDILVRHVFFYKAVLVFLSFSQKKTSGLVAHESSTF